MVDPHFLDYWCGLVLGFLFAPIQESGRQSREVIDLTLYVGKSYECLHLFSIHVPPLGSG